MGGSALVGVGLASSREPLRPPQPAPAAAPGWSDQSTSDPTDTTTPGPTTTSKRATKTSSPPAAMPRSEPVQLTIPRIKVSAKIMQLGVKDGKLETPPLAQADKAGWYKLGPTPGEIGNAVVVGHVDSREMGPAVFFDLGALKPGDTIDVKRADKKVAKFKVDGVKAYPKTEFPSELVYGGSNRASLRLITCGGTFDRKARAYPDNVIVFATLVPPGRGTENKPAGKATATPKPKAKPKS